MSSRQRAAKREGGRERVVRPFDFLRPNKLSRDHVRSLSLVMETFTRGVTTQLASQLRSVAQVTVKGVEQRAWDEYVRQAPQVAHVSILQLDPLPGAAVLTLPLEVAFTIAEMLMGGAGSIGGEVPQRSLTEIETSLIRSFTDRLLPELRMSFEPLCAVEPRVIGVESNPQFAQVAGSTDLVIEIAMQFVIESVTAEATLCIPWATIGHVLEDIVDKGQLANMKVDAKQARTRMLSRVDEVSVEVSARLRPVKLKSSQILGMEVGDVLMLGVPKDEPIVLWTGARPTHKAKAGKRGKKVAVEVLGSMMLDNQGRLNTSERRGGTR